MAYTTIDKPSDYFVSNLHTGNGSTQNITGLDFAPNWVWIKGRNQARNHTIFDSVRGVQKQIHSNKTSAESTQDNALSSFNSDGFSLGDNTGVNENTTTYASWNWKAETSFTNDASSTSIGSIDSAGSVNTTAGFSITSYTGTGSAGTIAHGLGATPAMIIFKNLSRATNWLVYHKDIAATKFLYLNATDQAGTDSGHFNDTEPTSSVFSVGNANGTNYDSEAHIAYCFAEKKGYSHFGTYLGNNLADGSFVYLGFKPAFLIIKITDTQTDGWIMQDNKRDTSNAATSTRFRANTSAAEFTSANEIDFLSNGFKCRGDDGEFNGNGVKYVYMAFAENPFVTSKGVPTTAR